MGYTRHWIIYFLAVLMLGCGGSPRRDTSITGYTHESADALINKFAGSVRPAGVEIKPFYKEEEVLTSNTSPFSCNHSHEQGSRSTYVVTKHEGNYVDITQTKVVVDQRCGGGFTNRYSGRYNSEWLFLRNADDASTFVFAYKISGAGSELTYTGMYRLVHGATVYAKYNPTSGGNTRSNYPLVAVGNLRESIAGQYSILEGSQRATSSKDSDPGLFKSLAAIGTAAYIGKASQGLGSVKQEALMRSSMNAVLNNDATEFQAQAKQATIRHEQEQAAKRQAIQENKDREERAARELKERNDRANAERVAQEKEKQRKQQEVTRQGSQQKDQHNQAQTRQLQQQQAQQQEKMRQEQLQIQQKERLRQEQQQALQQEKMRQEQEQARKTQLAAKKAEREAAKLAEQKAENQSREQYLKSVAAGTRLVATKCPDGEGKYYATGKRPNIKPEVVACVDVHFRAYCPGSTQFSAGVAHNFIGMSGCFGDTYDINPKPACKVDAVRIEVVEARICGG